MKDPMEILMFRHNPWTQCEPIRGSDEDEEQDPVKELEELDEPEEGEEQKPEGCGSIRAEQSRYSSVIAAEHVKEALDVITKDPGPDERPHWFYMSDKDAEKITQNNSSGSYVHEDLYRLARAGNRMCKQDSTFNDFVYTLTKINKDGTGVITDCIEQTKPYGPANTEYIEQIEEAERELVEEKFREKRETAYEMLKKIPTKKIKMIGSVKVQKVTVRRPKKTAPKPKKVVKKKK